MSDGHTAQPAAGTIFGYIAVGFHNLSISSRSADEANGLTASRERPGGTGEIRGNGDVLACPLIAQRGGILPARQGP